MRFDTIIVGGGLAGLSCGIRLSEQGRQCAIVSAGQNALHFSSGSLDLLNVLPDGTAVNRPINALAALSQQAPQHPYSLLGKENVTRWVEEAEGLLQRSGIALFGHANENHLRMTPLGIQKATWLSPPEIPTSPLSGYQRGDKPLIVGIEGFMDFQPQLVVDALLQQGISASTAYLHLPMLDQIRTNLSEFRAVNIARVLDKPEHCQRLADELNQLSGEHDALIFPACFGLDDPDLYKRLAEKLRLPLMILPTLPPSVLGLRMNNLLAKRFQNLGGVIIPGDIVLRTKMEKDKGWLLYTRNHTDIALRAQQVVLASGSFFSKGLVADRGCIREPVFGLDLLAETEREKWVSSGMFSPQPYLQFGVKTDAYLRVMRQGQRVNDVYAIGSVLGGYDPLFQGCGAGVSLVSALAVAEFILARQGAGYEHE